MRRSLLLIITMIFAAAAHAQTGDIVYLNNGNVVKGYITDSRPDGSIEVMTPNGNVYHYSQFDIREIKQGDISGVRQYRDRGYTAFEEQYRGYFFTAEGSLGLTIEHKQKTGFPVKLSVVNGYRVNEFFSIGIGVGVQRYVRCGHMREGSYKWSFPIYGDVRGNFVSHRGRNLVPYWSFDAGYSIKDDGAFFSPTVGLSFGGNRNNFMAGIFYTIQNLNNRAGEAYWLDAIGVKIGYQF